MSDVLEGHVALVTGGARGLGRAIAGKLASSGATVVVASRNVEACRATAAEITNETGGAVSAVRCDVTDEDEVKHAVAFAHGLHGRLDIVVNNSGSMAVGPSTEVSREQFRETMDVNVLGPWLVARAAAELMRAAGYGRILNIASAIGLVAGGHGETVYATAKGAVVNLTRSLAVEWADWGINVNAIAPGPFVTEMTRPFVDTPGAAAMLEHLVPLKRWGDPDEVSDAALYLVSPGASYTTGAILSVDGGRVAK